jgi:hypothetical protein
MVSKSAAYPQLIPWNDDVGLTDSPWQVVELTPEQVRDLRGTGGPSTDKGNKVLRIPKVVLRHDHWIRLHELYHVGRPTMVRGKNRLRNMVRKMLEEVALDSNALADGFDLRMARDSFDFSQMFTPENVPQAVQLYLQLYSNRDVSKNQGLLDAFHNAEKILDQEGLLKDVEGAAIAVWLDYSSGNCEDWADILTSKLLGKEPPPEPPCELPKPPKPELEEEDESEEDGDDDGAGGSGEPEEEDSEGTGDGGSGSDDTGDGDGMDEGDAGDADGGVDVTKPRANEPSEFDPNDNKGVWDDGWNAPEFNQPENTDAARERRAAAKEEAEAEAAREAAERKQGESSISEHLTGHTAYGTVDIHRHTFTHHATRTVALSWRSNEDGAIIRYPERLYQGGRVFATRSAGGSIILDCSGSMNWHTQVIIDAIKQLPRLYVAGYSYHYSAWSRRKGEPVYDARYCVIAQDGKVAPFEGVQEEREHSGENLTADATALAYAAKFAPRPIVWVSDGMVTGEEINWKNTDLVMRKPGIVRVLTIEDAIDYLTGKAVPGWHQCATVDTKYVRKGQPFQQKSIAPMPTYNEARKWTYKRLEARRKK